MDGNNLKKNMISKSPSPFAYPDYFSVSILPLWLWLPLLYCWLHLHLFEPPS